MAEITTAKLIPYEVDYLCDECQIGHMLPTGNIYPTSPPKIGHKCNTCGHTQIFLNKKYPSIEYKRELIHVD